MTWGPPRRLAGPRRTTARTRFTALYVTLFLLSGTALLTIAAVVASGGTRDSRTAPGGTGQPAAARAQDRVAELEQQLAQAHDDRTRQILTGCAIALGVMVVLSAVLGWFVAGRVLRPLRVMTAATRRITADGLHERLAMDGPGDEVKELADTIDDLLGRLESSFEGQRLFVANASHELRTPLTTMRASLDVALAKPGPLPPPTTTLAARLRTELDQVDRLLENFLVLARSRQGEFTDTACLALAPLASAALADRAEDIAAGDLTVRQDRADGTAWVSGSPTLLRRAVDNLVDNAVVHNGPGGWIGVAVRAEGSAVSLVVESGGPVLGQEAVTDLVRPFRRLGGDRTGTGRGSGLGLSIVAAIARAHHGTLDLRARPAGGLRVTLTLPGAGTEAAP
ncbi:sensor histidine kinase [Streptomyces sp. NBC_00209]|uniref:sensor histidine kinase n=1 Tax=Streptomyces sp. NBC_00209 TaxID=2975682 RepID=UPI0032562FD6